MRAVLDPNVLISALLSRSGTPARILERWLAGDFELVVSELLLTELRRSLGYRKLRMRIAPASAERFVALLEAQAVAGSDPPDPPPRSADRGDDYLIALAQAERAVLVTGDRHLTELGGRFPIQTPGHFLGTLERQT